MITDNEINDDTDKEEEQLPAYQAIEEKDNEQEIIHNEDDIVEYDISIESSDDIIYISVQEEP